MSSSPTSALSSQQGFCSVSTGQLTSNNTPQTEMHPVLSQSRSATFTRDPGTDNAWNNYSNGPKVAELLPPCSKLILKVFIRQLQQDASHCIKFSSLFFIDLCCLFTYLKKN